MVTPSFLINCILPVVCNCTKDVATRLNKATKLPSITRELKRLTGHSMSLPNTRYSDNVCLSESIFCTVSTCHKAELTSECSMSVRSMHALSTTTLFYNAMSKVVMMLIQCQVTVDFA